MFLESKLNRKNKITAINSWAVAVFRCEVGILCWEKSELKDVDRKSRKSRAIMEHYTQKAIWIDFTKRGKREVEVWLVWNIALEKRKIVWVLMLPILKKT